MDRATRTFTAADQRAFADASGDRNPLHLDAVAARRLLFGRPVVHGMHLVTWALSLVVPESGATLVDLKVKFEHAVGVDEPVEAHILSESGEHCSIHFFSAGRRTAQLRCRFVEGLTRRVALGRAVESSVVEPKATDVDSIADAHGRIRLGAGPLPGCPNLPDDQLAVLWASSYLVGMECPGQDSVFSALEMAFGDGLGHDEPALHYRTVKWHPIFRRLVLAVEGPGCQGAVQAQVRWPPQAQPAFAEIAREVEPGAYASQRALVVGGSRGLGEATVKVLAAGGATVALTYRTGAAEAVAVTADVQRSLGEPHRHLPAMRFDAETTPIDGLAEYRPSHLYYFATPGIFTGIDEHLFDRIYVDAFERIVEGLASSLRFVLYPSSTAVEHTPPGMERYAAAKARGEAICEVLRGRYPHLTIVAPRLGRVATDQTATFLATPAETAWRAIAASLPADPASLGRA